MKAPKNKCWIVAVDFDSFNYSPSLELISIVKKHNKTSPKGEHFDVFSSKENAQKVCDKLNSL